MSRWPTAPKGYPQPADHMFEQADELLRTGRSVALVDGLSVTVRLDENIQFRGIVHPYSNDEASFVVAILLLLGVDVTEVVCRWTLDLTPLPVPYPWTLVSRDPLILGHLSVAAYRAHHATTVENSQ